MSLNLVHVELRDANDFVEQNHRHHKKVAGHRFSIGAEKDGRLIGIAIVGRPVARMTDQKNIVEVTRLCTDGTKNACSFLYAASARAARALGYIQIQTFILDTETGISLKASGWEQSHTTSGGSWSRTSRERTDKHPISKKVKWFKSLN